MNKFFNWLSQVWTYFILVPLVIFIFVVLLMLAQVAVSAGYAWGIGIITFILVVGVAFTQ